MSEANAITQNTTCIFTIEQEIAPTRIDILLAQRYPEYSRSFFKKLVDDGHVACNKVVITKVSFLVKTHDSITVHFPASDAPRQAREIPHEITPTVLHEHPDFVIINKPAGLVVHDPSHYFTGPTLVDWLMKEFSDIFTASVKHTRPGIVHRLDQDTSGIMVIPRTSQAHLAFASLFHDRIIKKEYLTLVQGHPEQTGTITFPIGRDPVKRNRMTHQPMQGRQAKTDYAVLEYYKDSALVLVKPHTGRTHQIRVHFAAIGHPVVGDKVYGTASKHIKRHALHAYRLSFPYQGEQYTFTCEIPEDMQKLVDQK